MLTEHLGSGTMGEVALGHHIQDKNVSVAVKMIASPKREHQRKMLKQEIANMQHLHHKRIVGFKTFVVTKHYIFIVMECVPGGDLSEKLKSVGKFDEIDARKYFTQLTEGLVYCHSKGVCHRDLKPDQLLLDTEGNIKIADFGFSSDFHGDDGGTNALKTDCGTPNYVAPEILESIVGYAPRPADVWSCGVILYQLLCGISQSFHSPLHCSPLLRSPSLDPTLCRA